MVKGFNNTTSSVAATGTNPDFKPELYVPGMPQDLVLLCAADYTSSGATILLPTEGYVLSLSLPTISNSCVTTHNNTALSKRLR